MSRNKDTYKARHISQTRMSEGRSRGVAGRFSGGGRAVCDATPPAPLTRSGSDQNTTSRSANRAEEGASGIRLSGLEGSDTLSDRDVTSAEAGRSSSWQVETREKKSPGELTGGCVLERAGSSGQPSGQLIGKPVTHVGGGQVTHNM